MISRKYSAQQSPLGEQLNNQLIPQVELVESTVKLADFTASTNNVDVASIMQSGAVSPVASEPVSAVSPAVHAPQPSAIGQQVLTGINTAYSQQGKQLTINLNPPELGKVRLTVTEHNNQIRTVVKVEDPRTMADLQREAPLLVQRLSESGMEIRNLEIVLSNNNHASQSQSQQFAGAQHQWRNQQQAGDNGNERLFTQPREPQELEYAGSGLLNVWI